MATAGLQQTRQDADECGFASTVGAEQTEKFALLNVKAHAVEGLESAASASEGFIDGLKGNGCHK
jgi:hypothetical protein